ncbi:hypothetical protein LTR39_001368 [Cryomyces antarcticus]|nr:hypothetical protein LTR39_001368 [Cryomyces antarcticus]
MSGEKDDTSVRADARASLTLSDAILGAIRSDETTDLIQRHLSIFFTTIESLLEFPSFRSLIDLSVVWRLMTRTLQLQSVSFSSASTEDRKALLKSNLVKLAQKSIAEQTTKIPPAGLSYAAGYEAFRLIFSLCDSALWDDRLQSRISKHLTHATDLLLRLPKIDRKGSNAYWDGQPCSISGSDSLSTALTSVIIDHSTLISQDGSSSSTSRNLSTLAGSAFPNLSTSALFRRWREDVLNYVVRSLGDSGADTDLVVSDPWLRLSVIAKLMEVPNPTADIHLISSVESFVHDLGKLALVQTFFAILDKDPVRSTHLLQLEGFTAARVEYFKLIGISLGTLIRELDSDVEVGTNQLNALLEATIDLLPSMFEAVSKEPKEKQEGDEEERTDDIGTLISLLLGAAPGLSKGVENERAAERADGEFIFHEYYVSFFGTRELSRATLDPTVSDLAYTFLPDNALLEAFHGLILACSKSSQYKSSSCVRFYAILSKFDLFHKESSEGTQSIVLAKRTLARGKTSLADSSCR